MWNTGVSYIPTEILGAGVINGFGSDLRSWGGDVNGGGFNLLNVATLYVNGVINLGSAATGQLFLSAAGTAPYLGYGLVSNSFTFADTGGVYLTVLTGAFAGVGVLNNNPATPLDVAGAVTIRPVATPAAPTSLGEIRMYMSPGGSFALQYDDGGTIRYKYLPMPGTGVSFSQSTTAPS